MAQIDNRQTGVAVTAAGHVVLPIAGMTCASCASRSERRLNKLDGVATSVNYATERATVDFDPDSIDAAELVEFVEAAAYRAALLAAAAVDDTASLRRRLLISASFSLPVLLLSMIPALQFDNWQWLALQLATPVVVARGPSTAPRGSTSATAPRRWTR